MTRGLKTGGRKAGTPNKITTAFKGAVQLTYDAIGGHAAFADWAKTNPTEFYRIAARLIPTESTPATQDKNITITISGMGETGNLIEHAPDLSLIENF